MAPDLIITRGLPASGKTTFALGWVRHAEAGTRARVNRDEMRMALYGKYTGLQYPQEEAVTKAQQASVRALLGAGISVVVDDTNLRASHARAWRTLARSCGAEFSVADYTSVPVEVCIERDKARGRSTIWERSVGAAVIEDFAHRYYKKGKVAPLPEDEGDEHGTYTPDPRKPTAWLVDIDGTLAHLDGRGPFEWTKVGGDRLDETVASLVHLLKQQHTIIYMSGRDASCRTETLQWLTQHGLPVTYLFMRPAGDQRKDATVKAELFFDNVAPRFNVVGVLDDRDQVVEMWRGLGLKCLQVAPGAF